MKKTQSTTFQQLSEEYRKACSTEMARIAKAGDEIINKSGIPSRLGLKIEAVTNELVQFETEVKTTETHCRELAGRVSLVYKALALLRQAVRLFS